MDQASGGEDPNKPSKKKSGEDDGKNKKLVSIPPFVQRFPGCFVAYTTLCICFSTGHFY